MLSDSLIKNFNIIIDNNSKPACAAPSSCSNSPLPQFSVKVTPQDQTDDEPIRFTTPTPPLRNQAILATPISTVHNSYSQYFLTMNCPMLS